MSNASAMKNEARKRCNAPGLMTLERIQMNDSKSTQTDAQRNTAASIFNGADEAILITAGLSIDIATMYAGTLPAPLQPLPVNDPRRVEARRIIRDLQTLRARPGSVREWIDANATAAMCLWVLCGLPLSVTAARYISAVLGLCAGGDEGEADAAAVADGTTLEAAGGDYRRAYIAETWAEAGTCMEGRLDTVKRITGLAFSSDIAKGAA